jgi:hypothetical protein
MTAIQLLKELQHLMQPEAEVSKAVLTTACLPSHQCDRITHLLTPECLRVLVTQDPPSLLCLLVVQEALFHQVDQEGPTKQ